MGEVIDFNAARKVIEAKKDTGRCPTCDRIRAVCRCDVVARRSNDASVAEQRAILERLRGDKP
ncbi:MAG: hypothetical protein ACOYY2_04010 [Actinomycetota bacterium]